MVLRCFNGEYAKRFRWFVWRSGKVGKEGRTGCWCCAQKRMTLVFVHVRVHVCCCCSTFFHLLLLILLIRLLWFARVRSSTDSNTKNHDLTIWRSRGFRQNRATQTICNKTRKNKTTTMRKTKMKMKKKKL